MKTQSIFILMFCVLVLGMSSVAFAVDEAEPDPEPNCESPSNQLEMNDCTQQAFAKQDDALNRLYKQQLAKLETPAVKERFKKAQQQWVKFRDTSCEYEIGPREESGSIWPMLQLDCMRAFTEERVKRLQYYVDCNEDQCPH